MDEIWSGQQWFSALPEYGDASKTVVLAKSENPVERGIDIVGGHARTLVGTHASCIAVGAGEIAVERGLDDELESAAGLRWRFHFLLAASPR